MNKRIFSLLQKRNIYLLADPYEYEIDLDRYLIDPEFDEMKYGNLLTVAGREVFDERAGIIEFDAGFSKQEAEKKAWEEILLCTDKELKKIWLR